MIRIDGRAPAPPKNSSPPIVSWRQTSMSPLKETMIEESNNSSLLFEVLILGTTSLQRDIEKQYHNTAMTGTRASTCTNTKRPIIFLDVEKTAKKKIETP